MGKIYVHQDLLKIELNYVELPGEVKHAWIKYRNPEGRERRFPAPALHNPVNRSFYIIFDAGESLGDYGPVGMWRFWLWLEMEDGRTIPGEAVKEMIYKEGE